MDVQHIAIYARRSHKEDLQPGEQQEPSTKRQVADCHKYAELKGWTVADRHVFAEPGRSAYSGAEREQFELLMAALASGEVNGVVTWKFDRLTANRSDLDRLLTLVERDGIVIASVTEGIDSTSEMGSFVLELLGAVSRMERKNTSVRVRRALVERARVGKPHGGRRRVGFEKDGVTHREPEVERLQDAARRLLDGKSASSIVNGWNDAGFTMPSGARWSVTSLRRVLISPRAAGLRVHQGEVVGDAIWKGILDRDVWEAVCRHFGVDPNRRDRLPGRGAGGGRPAVHLLSGLLVCGRDGVRLYARRQHGTWVYVCQPSRGGCNLGVLAEPTDDHVTKKALELLDNDAVIRRLLDVGGDAADMTLAVEEESLAAKLERIDDAHDDGIYDKPEWLRRRGPVVQRLEQVRAQRARVQPKRNWLRLGDSPVGLWLNGDIPTRRRLLSLVVDRVEVQPVGKTGGKFHPSRVRVIPVPELLADRTTARIVATVLRHRS